MQEGRRKRQVAMESSHFLRSDVLNNMSLVEKRYRLYDEREFRKPPHLRSDEPCKAPGVDEFRTW